MSNIRKYIYSTLKLNGNKNPRKLFVLSFVVLAVLSSIYLRYTWISSINATSQQAIKSAEIAATSLNGETVKKLSGVKQDLGTIAHESITNRLTDLVKIEEGIDCAYIFTQRDDRLYYIADSEPVDPKSLPGEEYIEATNEDKKPFKDGKPIITKPSKDHWGTWVSPLIPMKDSETGEIIAVLGIDYPAKTWNDNAHNQTVKASIIIFALFLLMFSFFVIFNKNLRLKEINEKVINLSHHDQLTGLYNRRFYEEELKRIDTKINHPLTIVMADVNGLKIINDSFGHAMGDELLKKTAEVMRAGCRADDIIARIGGDEFVILLPKTDAFEAGDIIKRINDYASKEVIVCSGISISFGYETKDNEEEEIEEIFKKSENYMYRKKHSKSSSMKETTIGAIFSNINEKNQSEQLHSHRVSELCGRMGEAIELNEYEIMQLKMVAMLHDIGKVEIDENILNKPGKLTEDEWKEIKRHSEIGYRIINSVNDMSDMAGCVLTHHERWDGKGYPKGLKEEEIPLMSRIIAIADAYDAMTSDRSYRSALPEEAALEELQNNAGTQFDPGLVSEFVEKILSMSQYK